MAKGTRHRGRYRAHTGRRTCRLRRRPKDTMTMEGSTLLDMTATASSRNHRDMGKGTAKCLLREITTLHRLQQITVKVKGRLRKGITIGLLFQTTSDHRPPPRHHLETAMIATVFGRFSCKLIRIGRVNLAKKSFAAHWSMAITLHLILTPYV